MRPFSTRNGFEYNGLLMAFIVVFVGAMWMIVKKIVGLKQLSEELLQS